ncbi:mitochondrial antiviral-signaling protein [Rhinoraja longicauda]
MTFVGDALYSYIRVEMQSFLRINVTELLPHLSCLTQMDQERVRALVKTEGNEAAVPILLDSVRRRRNWERQLIDALCINGNEDLAVGLENKLESLAPRRQSAPGGTSARFPTQATVDNSSVTHVSPPPRSQSVAPGGPSPTLIVAGDRLAFPDIIPPAAYLQPDITGLQPTVQAQHSASSTPAPSPAAPQLASDTPMLNTSVQSTPAPQPAPDTPMHNTPVQSTAVLETVSGTPMLNVPVQSTTVPLSVPDTPLPNTPGQSTAVVGTQVPNTPAQSTPFPQTVPGTSSPRSPETQSTPSTPVSGTLVPPRSGLPAAVSNARGESSPVPSLLPQSIECRVPVQEMGSLLGREESQDWKQPVQEKTVHSARSNPSDISNLQLDQTKPLNQGIAGDKCKVPSTDRAKGKTITDQAVAMVPSPSTQLHLPRPAPEANADVLRTMDRPGALRSDVENVPEGCCSITSSALQISGSTMSTAGNHGMGGTAPVNRYPAPTSTLTRISEDPHDENSIKEQKIRALRGYQNDELREEFYDVNFPLNIQRNFDAQKKAAALNEAAGLAQEDNLNQNNNGEFHHKNKPNPISSSEVTQCPAFTSSHPGDNGVASEPVFLEDVQPSDSNAIISSSELMFSSGSSGNSSFQNSSADSDIEASVGANQDSVNAGPQKNLPEFLYSDVQVPAWTEGANGLRQNPTLEHDYKPEYTGDVARHLTHPDGFTEAGSGEESSPEVDVSAGENPFHANYEESHGEHYFNAEDNHTSACSQDVKEYTGHIHQEPYYENEAGNVREFEAGNSRDYNRHYAEEVSTDVLSNKHVPLASQQRSQTNLPEKPTGDLWQPDYVLVSTIVLVFTIVAGFVWKHYHK